MDAAGGEGGAGGYGKEVCGTSSDGAQQRPPAAASGGAERMPRRLGAEVDAAVDKFNWPPLLAREWTPSAFPAHEGGVDAPNAGAIGGGGGGEGAGGGGKRLKVLTWNVLCDGLSGSHPERGGFLMAPEGSLDWEKRRWKLLEEILRWDCDVLVLQEVDHHHDWFSPMLAKEGFRSLFVKKPIAPGMTFSPSLEDGCSLFYRATVPGGGGGRVPGALEGREAEEGNPVSEKTTLDLLDAHSFTYAISEKEHEEEEKVVEGEGEVGGGGEVPAESDESKNKKAKSNDGETAAGGPRASQNQVAMVSLLSVNAGRGGGGSGSGRGGDEEEEESLVVVATTHLKASKNQRGEVMRARQAQQLLDEVTRFREGHERGRGLPPGSIPLIVAGDFNAAPHRSKAGSGGYEPMCFRQVTSHPLALQSAFPLEGAFTTWKIRPGPKPAAAAVVEDAAGGGGSAEGDGVTGAWSSFTGNISMKSSETAVRLNSATPSHNPSTAVG